MTERVVNALGLPMDHYAQDPDVQYLALAETNGALRDLIGYRLYRDLQRGWRVTAPNLEQTGLLEIRYASLAELSADERVWASSIRRWRRPSARPQMAPRSCWTSSAEPGDPGGLSEPRLAGQASPSVQPIPDPAVGSRRGGEARGCGRRVRAARSAKDFQGNRFISGRSGMGQYAARDLSDARDELKIEDREQIIRDLLEGLRVAGLVGVVEEPKNAAALRATS